MRCGLCGKNKKGPRYFLVNGPLYCPSASLSVGEGKQSSMTCELLNKSSSTVTKVPINLFTFIRAILHLLWVFLSFYLSFEVFIDSQIH